jgi:hypothetical protein
MEITLPSSRSHLEHRTTQPPPHSPCSHTSHHPPTHLYSCSMLCSTRHPAALSCLKMDWQMWVCQREGVRPNLQEVNNQDKTHQQDHFLGTTGTLHYYY